MKNFMLLTVFIRSLILKNNWLSDSAITTIFLCDHSTGRLLKMFFFLSRMCNTSLTNLHIRVLSDDAHDVVLLKYALGYDNREISEITGFSVAKIEKLLSRSKKKLQEKLAKKVVSVTEGDN